MFQLNQISDNEGAKHRRLRVGRGIGSGKGKTCGRGVKGQKSRSGVAIKGFEGGQMPLHRRLPKRGFVSRNKKDYAIINVGQLQAAIDNQKLKAGATINYSSLLEAGLIKKSKHGLRILAAGEISKKLAIIADGISAVAKQKIEAAGGSVEVTMIPNAEEKA